jgi:hypothetical protein
MTQTTEGAQAQARTERTPLSRNETFANHAVQTSRASP